MPRTEIEVVPVDAETWPELARLFERDEVTRACWCMWPRCLPRTFQPSEHHRAGLRALIDRGETPGLLARIEGEPVGWCAIGRQREFPQYSPDESPDAWAIPCVYVAERARGNGVLRALIDAAVQRVTNARGHTLYGPPPWWIAGDETATGAIVNTFLKRGFEQCGEGGRFPLLARRLTMASAKSIID